MATHWEKSCWCSQDTLCILQENMWGTFSQDVQFSGVGNLDIGDCRLQGPFWMLTKVEIDCLHHLLGIFKPLSTNSDFKVPYMVKTFNPSEDSGSCRRGPLESSLKVDPNNCSKLFLKIPGSKLKFALTSKAETTIFAIRIWWRGAITFLDTEKMWKNTTESYNFQI